jgi:hypothetical protein
MNSMTDIELMGDIFSEYLLIQEEEASEWEGFEAPELTEEDIEDWYLSSDYPRD